MRCLKLCLAGILCLMIVQSFVAPMDASASVLQNGAGTNKDVGISPSSAGSYTIAAVSDHVRVVKGQIARLAVRVDFLDGFTTSGGISFSVPEDTAGLTSFAPAPVMSAGGTELSINTATLAAGTYSWSIRASEANWPDQYATFTLKVVTVTDVTFDPPTIAATQQQAMYVSVTGTCSDGQALPYDAYTLASGDPLVFGVYPDRWGGYSFYPQESGDTSLTATCPDGFTKSAPVSINIPDYPKILSVSFDPPIVSNSGTEQINFEATGNAPLGYVSSDIPWSGWPGEFGDQNLTYTGTGTLNPGCEPGPYLFRASSAYSPYPMRVGSLTIVNDPATGQIRGRKHMLGGAGGMELHGLALEIYDTAGNLVKTWSNWSMDNNIHGYAIAPGTYRVRYGSSDVPGGAQSEVGGVSQWYPNASSFATAGDVVVQAGETVDNINFFFEPPSPMVTYTDPSDGATEVPLGQAIYASFSTYMDVSTLDVNTIKVENASHEAVTGTVTTDGWSASFTPDAPLSSGTRYTVTVTTGAKGVDGTPLKSDYVWSFTTIAVPSDIADLKAKEDGAPVTLEGKVLYYTQGNFGYIQESNRPVGIRIQGASEVPLDVAEGRLVSLMGTMATSAGGERFIQLGTLTPGDYAELGPLGANGKSLKTNLMGGLYVRAWGTVLSVGLDSYVISDGTDASGILVHTYETPTVTEGQVGVVVSGAAGWEGTRVIHGRN